MFSNPLLNKIVIISFMVLIGFTMAKAFYTGSFIAIALAFVGLGAAVYFVYLFNGLRKAEVEAEESN